LLKRYHDLSEGLPREALAQIEVLKAVKESGIENNIDRLIEVYTRGKEVILVFQHHSDTISLPITLD
jgi:hypothetical protein